MVAIVLRHGHGVAGRPAARNNAYFVHRVAVGQHARHNGVDNARFAVADAGAFMRDMAAQAAAVGRAGTDEEGRPLVLLMDPPRAGSTEEFLRAAVQLAPERIAYISCNPETQVRDLGFLKQFGYGVRTVQPVDMFPHTDHIETIALIERM